MCVRARTQTNETAHKMLTQKCNRSKRDVLLAAVVNILLLSSSVGIVGTNKQTIRNLKICFFLNDKERRRLLLLFGFPCFVSHCVSLHVLMSAAGRRDYYESEMSQKKKTILALMCILWNLLLHDQIASHLLHQWNARRKSEKWVAEVRSFVCKFNIVSARRASFSVPEFVTDQNTIFHNSYIYVIQRTISPCFFFFFCSVQKFKRFLLLLQSIVQSPLIENRLDNFQFASHFIERIKFNTLV